MLANEKFVANAAPEAVAAEREKLAQYLAELRRAGLSRCSPVAGGRLRAPSGCGRCSRELGDPQRAVRGDPRRRHEREVDDDSADGGAPRRRRPRGRGVSLAACRAAGTSGSASAARRPTSSRPSSASAPRRSGSARRSSRCSPRPRCSRSRSAEIDVAVVEAGLGGRHDATNVLRSRVVVLTNVALDHMDVLGDTREEIAAEKLAVVQPGCTVVLARARVERARRAERRRRGRRHGPQQPGARRRGRGGVPGPLGRPARRRGRLAARAPRAPRRASARDLGRSAQPRRRRLAAAASASRPRRLGRRLLDPARQAPRADARGPLGARLDPRRHGESQRSRAPGRRARRARAGRISSVSRPSPSPRPRTPERSSSRGRTGRCSSRAPCTFSPSSVPTIAPDSPGEKLAMFALAACRPRRHGGYRLCRGLFDRQDAPVTAAPASSAPAPARDHQRTSAVLRVRASGSALGYWTYKDARRRIEDPLFVGLSMLLGARVPLRRPVHLHALPPARVPRGRAGARARDQGDGGSHLGSATSAARSATPRSTRAILVCPVCTTKLKQACVSCSAPLEPIWQICPYCETPIELRRRRAPPALGTRRVRRAAAADRSPRPIKCRPPMAVERTLILIKPDAVRRRLAGEILGRIEARGFDDPRREARSRRAVSSGRSTTASIARSRSSASSSSSSPQARRGRSSSRAKARSRRCARRSARRSRERGAGNNSRRPRLSMPDNLVHGSDSPESAEREIALWFGALSPTVDGTWHWTRERGVHGRAAPSRRGRADEITWGIWHVPESELHALPDLAGKRCRRARLRHGVLRRLAQEGRRGPRRSASIRRLRSSRPRAAAARSSASVSSSWRRSGRTCRSRTRRSTSSSRSTAPRSGPIRTSGSPRRRGCCAPAASSSFCATRRSSSSARRTRTWLPSETLQRPQFGMHRFPWPDATAASSTTSRTATGSGCCARTASSSST